MEMFIEGLEVLRRLARLFGPYVMVEILLPGGTMVALLLYLYRRRSAIRDALRRWRDASHEPSWYARTAALFKACIALGANNLPERA